MAAWLDRGWKLSIVGVTLWALWVHIAACHAAGQTFFLYAGIGLWPFGVAHGLFRILFV